MDDSDAHSTSSSSNASISSQTSNKSMRIAERERRKKEGGDPFVVAMDYFSNFKAGTVVKGNHVLENNLAVVERLAYSKGLPPEAISIMLELTMSSRLGSQSYLLGRVLKFLIPTTVVPQETVCRAIVWIFAGKLPISAQVLFLKWVLTMYDMIDCKDHLRSMYGFLFSLVTDSDLWPYVCHLLCLLTRKESVRLHRVRKLLELKTKLGQQPVLLHLLALYKMLCPELVPCSFSSKTVSFKNYNSNWKTSLATVQKNNACTVASVCLPSALAAKKTKARKRKHGAHLELPVLCAAPKMETQKDRFCKLVPMIQMQSFSELLSNLGNIELPAQMGSLLGSHLALHYLDCIQDESAYLRLNAWVGNALAEEFLCCSDEDLSSSDEAVQFLERLHSAQSFLQEGLASTEIFLNSFLSVWDGSHLRPQILKLLSFYPVVPTSHMKQLLFEPIMQLFCTATVFFKCAVIESLKNMLQRWLTWHSVYAVADSSSLDISLHSQDNPMNMTLSAFTDSVMEVVNFVGRLSSLGLQLEHGHALLLSISLDFYEMVCDIFMKYGLPLVVMPPKGVFYPALLCTEPISVDRMARIMYRYKINLTAAKEQQTQSVHFSSQTYQEFNYYAKCMINCLWNIKSTKTGMDLPISEDLLLSGEIPGFDLSHHPAFLIYAINFHHQCWPESRDMDLNSIKSPKEWNWYLEYLYDHFEGLKQFANSMIK